MRNIWHINIHCSASDFAHHDNVQSIYQWHVVENGWSDIGYHFIITKNGDIHICRPISRNPASVKNHNEGGIGIMLTGKYKFSDAQFKSLRRLVQNLSFEYKIKKEEVRGHNEYSGHFSRECPNFDVKEKVWGTRGIHQTH